MSNVAKLILACSLSMSAQAAELAAQDKDALVWPVQAWSSDLQLSQSRPPQQIATGEQAPPSPAGSLEDTFNRVTNAERLMFRLVGYPEMTGEYRVSANGTLSLPIVGRISLTGLDVGGLERLIATKIKDITGRPVYPTIEITKYRSVYVTGFVNTSGAEEWQPNLNVLQAVALSCGIYRRPENPDALSRYNKAIADRRRLLATLARAQAERDGLDNVATPDRLVAIAGRPQAEELTDQERTLFRSRRSALDSQLTALERGKELAQQELTGLQEQSKHLDQQLALRRTFNDNIQSLLQKGLVNEERALQEAIYVSDLEEKITNVTVAVARVQEQLSGDDREIATLHRTHDVDAVSEAMKLQHDLAQLEYEIEASGAELQGTPARGGALEPLIIYNIKRQIGGNVQLVAANEATLLLPGDVLVVSQDVR